MLVINMEYGESFSGPGQDTFHEDRSTLDPSRAHISNFLHPVLYFYPQPLRGIAGYIGSFADNILHGFLLFFNINFIFLRFQPWEKIILYLNRTEYIILWKIFLQNGEYVFNVKENG